MKKKRPSIINFSFIGGMQRAVNQAVEAAIKAGLVVVVAAGNSNNDACNFTPVSVQLAIAVGALDVDEIEGIEEDIRTSYSNFGPCIDVWAPGTLITSAWRGFPNELRTISGTSTSSAHVSGVASLILSANPSFTPAQVEAKLIEHSTKGIINLNCLNREICFQSPNRLVYTGCKV